MTDVRGAMGVAAADRGQLVRPRFRRATIVPFLAAVGLAFALVLFGSGPGDSGVKVNLLGVQPIEAIRLLAVFALSACNTVRGAGEDVESAADAVDKEM